MLTWPKRVGAGGKSGQGQGNLLGRSLGMEGEDWVGVGRNQRRRRKRKHGGRQRREVEEEGSCGGGGCLAAEG